MDKETEEISGIIEIACGCKGWLFCDSCCPTCTEPDNHYEDGAWYLILASEYDADHIVQQFLCSKHQCQHKVPSVDVMRGKIRSRCIRCEDKVVKTNV